MQSIHKIEKLPDYRLSVKSISKVLGKSYNKHATITNLIKHMPKCKRWFGKLVVKAFIKEGLLRKHRTNTFSWTEKGLRYSKEILAPLSGIFERIGKHKEGLICLTKRPVTEVPHATPVLSHHHFYFCRTHLF